MPNNDLFYFPDSYSASRHISGWDKFRTLLVGEAHLDKGNFNEDFGPEIRFHNARTLVAPKGYYIHDIPNDRTIVIVTRGQDEAMTTECAYDYTDDSNNLVRTRFTIDELWTVAVPLDSETEFKIGDIVVLAGTTPGIETRGYVVRIDISADGVFYEVDINGRRQQASENSLVKYDADSTDPRDWIQNQPSSSNDISASLTYIKLTNSLTDTIYSYAASKTVYRAYQYKPALKLITNDLDGLLIADEVGLGKTIESGIIWNELEHRGDLRNVLIVVPSNLRDKWQLEMRRRFDRDIPILTRQHFDLFIEDIENGQDRDIVGIASMQSLRSYDKLDRLIELSIRFDLLIIDEAHHMRNKGVLTNELGRTLVSMADKSVLLSATPVNMRSNDLFNLLNMLDEGNFPTLETYLEQIEPNRVLNECASKLLSNNFPASEELLTSLRELDNMPYGPSVTGQPAFKRLVAIFETLDRSDFASISEAKRLLADLSLLSTIFTRTRKVDVPQGRAVRDTRMVNVTWTPEERSYYEILQRILHQEALDSGYVVPWALQMPLRQATSCLPASMEKISNKRGLTAEDVEDYDFDSFTDDQLLDFTGHVPATDGALTNAINLIHNRGILDSKYEELKKTLKQIQHNIGSSSRPMPQVLLFSFFKMTLEYLQLRLEQDGFNVRLMYGPTPQKERTRMIQDFRLGKFDILLVSEVGSEGLDFEFCNVLVNYDLPWNPMKIEQRIGRLDRFGQQNERIFIFNMTIADTIEGKILSRLFERIDIFRDTVGDLDPIILADIEHLSSMALDPNRSTQEMELEADRIAVALENQRRTLQDLENNRGILLGLDQASIDGWLDNDAPARGRYIGNQELLNLMEYALPLFESSITAMPHTDPRDQRFTIRGSTKLAAELYLHSSLKYGTTLGIQELKQRCENLERIEVTLSSDYASKYDFELLSVRHPFVKIALNRLSDSLNQTKFGVGILPSLNKADPHLVLCYLAKATGTKPKLELWPFAINLRTGEFAEDVGDELLKSLAERTLQTWQGEYPSAHAIENALQKAMSEMRQKYNTEHESLRIENELVVQRKIQTVKSVSGRKIDSIQQQIQNDTDSKIKRMHLVMLDRERESLNRKLDKLTFQENMALSLEPVAVILIKQ